MWYSEQTCSLDDFIAVLADRREQARVPHAARIEDRVPVYDSQLLRRQLQSPGFARTLMAELATVLADGAGAFVLERAYADTVPVDRATAVFNRIIEAEKGLSRDDHFAKAGANDRIWNALEKLCREDAQVFVDYYANDMLALAARSWLGPGYQVTSQINVVRPGGAAQEPHCDYHLGFLTAAEAGQYPAHVHRLTPALTLQAGIAHCDMPRDSGPTKILPFSQAYGPGYMAWRRDDFRDYFENHHAQLPLAKGDVLIFNPSLFHAAGANRTKDVARMANLLQISSAFGIAMERIDRRHMCRLLYPLLLEAQRTNRLTQAEIANVIASSAPGYAFPVNLDETPPADGLAPRSMQHRMHEALRQNLSAQKFSKSL